MIHFPAKAWNLHASLTRFFHLIFFFYFLHAFPREAFQHVGSSRKSTCFSLGSFPAHQQTSQIYMLFPEPFAIFSFISEYPHAFTKRYFHQMRKYLNSHASLARFFHLIFFFYFLHAFPREAFHHVGNSLKSTCFSPGSFPSHKQTSQIYMLFPNTISIKLATAVNLHAFPWEAFQHISSSHKSTCFSRNLLPSFLLFLNIHMLSPNAISIK